MARYGSVNNVKHVEMEDAFMNFTPETAARDSAFTELTTTNRNLSMQLMHQEDHSWALKAELCNFKVVAATQTNDMKGNNKGVHPYLREKK